MRMKIVGELRLDLDQFRQEIFVSAGVGLLNIFLGPADVRSPISAVDFLRRGIAVARSL